VKYLLDIVRGFSSSVLKGIFQLNLNRSSPQSDFGNLSQRRQMEQEKDARFVADEQPAIQLRATCNYNSHGLTEAPSDFASARHASDSEHAREGRKERKMGNRTTGQGAQPVRVGSIGRDATQVRGRPPA
jgi:hypothetical protein